MLGRRGQNFGEEKRWEKKTCGQGGWDFCSFVKRLQQAHPQLVHWWLLVHSSQCIRTLVVCIVIKLYLPIVVNAVSTKYCCNCFSLSLPFTPMFFTLAFLDMHEFHCRMKWRESCLFFE